MHTVVSGQALAADETYVVEQGGVYDPLDLVPCRRAWEPAGTANCAFLAIYVATGSYGD
jgi:hypothetical protein